MATGTKAIARPDAEEVRAIGVFSDLPAAALQECCATAVPRSVVKGESIFHQGDGPARFHCLVEGWVRVLQAGPDGGLSVIRFVGPGELFGSFAIFAQTPYPADAIAATDAIELSWSEAQLRGLVERHPRIAMNLVAVAAHRLGELQERVREISTQPAEQRIASALLRLSAKGAERKEDGRLDLAFPLRRKDVAEISATTLYTASRTISAWARKGIVASSGRRMSIISPLELKRIADGG
jgi:CRP-like cAMP-binding protein